MLRPCPVELELGISRRGRHRKLKNSKRKKGGGSISIGIESWEPEVPAVERLEKLQKGKRSGTQRAKMVLSKGRRPRKEKQIREAVHRPEEGGIGKYSRKRCLFGTKKRLN